MGDNLTSEIFSKPELPVSPRVRIAKWDNAKFLLIMFVVIGHFLDTYGRGTSDFLDWLRFSRLFIDMPAFIFISGLFSKKTIDSTPMPFYKILPYFNLFLVIRILMFIDIRLLRDPKYQLSFVDFQTIAWFCFAIFIFHIVLWLIRDIDVRYTMFFALLAACFAGYDKNIGNFLCLSRMILFFPFFLAGYATSQEKLLQFIERREVKLFAVVFLITLLSVIFVNINLIRKFLVFLCWQYPFPASGSAASSFINPLPWCVARALHLAVTTVTCLSFLSLVPSREIFFTALGRRTAAVYALHMAVLNLYGYLGLPATLKKAFGAYYDIVFLIIPIVVTFLLSAECVSKIFEPLLRPKIRHR